MSFGDIIAKVKAHPELWQSSHPFYRHRVVSARTWKEIATELRADEITIRKRWKHLKDQYRKEQKKVISNTIPMSFWHHYNDLHFLSDDMLRVNLKSAATAEASDSDKNTNNSDSDDAPLKAKRPRKSSNVPTVSSPKTTVLKTQEVGGMHTLIARSPDAGKLNLILNRLHAMEEAIHTTSHSTEDTKKNNSDYMFLLSLLPIMKKLTDIQKLQFRGKMNDWLLDIVTQNEYSDRLDYKTYIQTDIKDIQPPDWNVVKKRWKHLKDTFRKEVKKVTSNQVALSSWLHYNELQFLTDEITKKHKKQESEASETESESEKKPLKVKRMRKRKRLDTISAPVDTTSQSSIKFRKIMRSLNILSKSIDRPSNFFDEDLKNDTDYMFLVSLLPTMKNLSDVQRLHFRGKINNWLLTALMENEFSAECDTKAFVQVQISDANIQDCKLEIDNK